jgi:hypothetical protein
MLEEENMIPVARKEKLFVEEVVNELVVYDQERHRAHRLNPTAAWVWRHCDGERTVGDMAALMRQETKAPASDDLIWLALERLDQAHLLESFEGRPDSVADVSRRELIGKLKVAGLVGILLPVVESLVSPTPAQAQSKKK